MVERKQDMSVSIGLLVLRLGIGGFLLTHGLGKLQMTIAGEFAKFGDPIGLGNTLSLVLVTIAEFFCALAVLLGFATRFAAAVIVFSMSVAVFVAHGADPWTMERGYALFTSGASKSWASKEPALLYLVPFLALVFTGAGRLSVDSLVAGRRRSRPGKPYT